MPTLSLEQRWVCRNATRHSPFRLSVDSPLYTKLQNLNSMVLSKLVPHLVALLERTDGMRSKTLDMLAFG